MLYIKLQTNAEKDKQELLFKISIIEKENYDLVAAFNKATNEAKCLDGRIQELIIAGEENIKQIENIEDVLKVSR